MGKNAPVSYGYPIQADPTNVMGRRIGAYFIDLALASTLAFILLLAIADKVPTSEVLSRDDCHSTFSIDRDTINVSCDNAWAFTVNDEVYIAPFAPVLLTFFGLSFLNLVLLTTATGASIGKRLTGIRVVRESGEQAGLGANVVRWLFLCTIDGFFMLVGLITSIVSRGHRRVGDMVAKTNVVSSAAVGQPVFPQAAAGPYGVPYGAPPPGYPQPGYPQQGQPWPAAGAPTQWPPQPQAQPQPQPEPAAWAQPTPSQQQSQPVASEAGSPQWDEARKAYIQWDPGRQAWLQWNDTSREWRPIDT
jgi:uncharacterized RDD family membrane protein YckC